MSGELIESVRAVPCRQNVDASVFEEQPCGIPYELVIVNDEDCKTAYQRESANRTVHTRWAVSDRRHCPRPQLGPGPAGGSAAPGSWASSPYSSTKFDDSCSRPT
jgi:hypothetical protein